MKASFTPSFSEEKIFWEKGITHVIGIDEVGRGCFAGPVVTAGVVFHPDYFHHFEDSLSETFSWLHEIHDSKLLLRKTREKLSPLIQKNCLHFSMATIDVPTINVIGIGKATFLGMRKVCKEMVTKCHPGLDPGSFPLDSRFCGNDKLKIAVLVDAFKIPQISLQQKPIIKGDQKSISIAAASIIAKVYRDNLMNALAQKYNGYYFEQNKGYGTKDHREAIKKYGLSEMHRTSFNLGKYI